MTLFKWYLPVFLSLAILSSCTKEQPAPVAEAGDQLPFTIRLRSIPVEAWGGGHSFATIEYEGYVIMIGGRLNGMHHFPQTLQDTPQAFPSSMANNQIIMMELATGKVIAQKSVDSLPSPINLHLQSTNAQYATEDGWFYYVGGYGDDPDNPSMFTMPYVTAIQVDALVAALRDPSAQLDETFRNQHMAFTDDFVPSAKVTGGDMQPVFDKAGNRKANTFHLVFGHSFDGMYFASGASAVQVYRNRVDTITLAVAANSDPSLAWQVNAKSLGTNPSPVQDAENLPPDNPFHRRDLTVAPSFQPGAGMAVTAYGGVFKGDLGGFLEPIYIQFDDQGKTTLYEDVKGKQLLSHYKCPVIQMFDASSETMYSTFFAGISYYYWDAAQGKLVHDVVSLPVDGLPFIDSVSTLVAKADGGTIKTSQYLIDGLTFPPADDVFDCQGKPVEYLGSETHLIPTETGPPRFANGVIDVDTWKKSGTNSYVIGYLIGGIASTAPYSARGETCPSNRIYEVTVSLNAQPVTPLPIPND